jgi:hypothetical protein
VRGVAGLDVLHVGELHVQVVGAGVVVAKVHLREAFGGDARELPLVGALLAGGGQPVCATTTSFLLPGLNLG